MKIVFFGSSEFAVPPLEALRNQEEVILVVTQPDRKKGRSLKLASTPVKIAADRIGLKTFQPDSVNSKDSTEYLKKINADLFIVVSFGQILRKELLDIPGLYPLNVHASLLPKYRGAAPVNWAIANGEEKTGVTIIKMDEKMDEGDIILKEAVPIEDTDDAVSLSERLSGKGAMLLLKAIDLIKTSEISFIKQDETKATYAPRLKKEDGLIDWQWPAGKIYSRIRAFVPWPGCYTYYNKKVLKIWKARPDISHKDAGPGAVLECEKKGILVNTGQGSLRIEELQLEGRRRMKAEEFIIGHEDMTPGSNFTLQSLS